MVGGEGEGGGGENQGLLLSIAQEAKDGATSGHAAAKEGQRRSSEVGGGEKHCGRPGGGGADSREGGGKAATKALKTLVLLRSLSLSYPLPLPLPFPGSTVLPWPAGNSHPLLNGPAGSFALQRPYRK